MNTLHYFIVLVILSLISACYSFKGISIAPEISSFKLEQVEDVYNKAPAGYPIDFYEALNAKIRKDSRLVFNSSNPDIVFQCKITQFEVSSQAPRQDITSYINRCSVVIEVEFTNKQNEKENWKTNFSRYVDFDANVNFSSIQQQITQELSTLLVDDIFNKAFTNW